MKDVILLYRRIKLTERKIQEIKKKLLKTTDLFWKEKIYIYLKFKQKELIKMRKELIEKLYEISKEQYTKIKKEKVL
jgi:hypothetical protein